MKLLSFPDKQNNALDNALVPVTGIIDLLENALERAKNGEIQAVFLVGVSSDGNVLSAWNDNDAQDTASNPYIMLGAISYAVHEYRDGMIDQ